MKLKTLLVIVSSKSFNVKSLTGIKIHSLLFPISVNLGQVS